MSKQDQEHTIRMMTPLSAGAFEQPSGLNGYELIQYCGGGTFGKVFLVRRDNEDELRVAKTVDLTESATKKGALQEASLLLNLHHPNVVTCFEAFVYKGSMLVMIMEYCHGGDLSCCINNMNQIGHRFTEAEIRRMLYQLLSALCYIHEQNVLHRDLKPSNILIDHCGNLKLADFGVAKRLPKGSCANTSAGTPNYMPPEMCKKRPYTYHSDMWSLGCVLYEMITLRSAFSGDSVIALCWNVCYEMPPPIPNDGRYSRGLIRVVESLLSKEPENRKLPSELLASDIFIESPPRNISPFSTPSTASATANLPHRSEDEESGAHLHANSTSSSATAGELPTPSPSLSIEPTATQDDQYHTPIHHHAPSSPQQQETLVTGLPSVENNPNVEVTTTYPHDDDGDSHVSISVQPEGSSATSEQIQLHPQSQNPHQERVGNDRHRQPGDSPKQLRSRSSLAKTSTSSSTGSSNCFLPTGPFGGQQQQLQPLTRSRHQQRSKRRPTTLSSLSEEASECDVDEASPVIKDASEEQFYRRDAPRHNYLCRSIVTNRSAKIIDIILSRNSDSTLYAQMILNRLKLITSWHRLNMVVLLLEQSPGWDTWIEQGLTVEELEDVSSYQIRDPEEPVWRNPSGGRSPGGSRNSPYSPQKYLNMPLDLTIWFKVLTKNGLRVSQEESVVLTETLSKIFGRECTPLDLAMTIQPQKYGSSQQTSVGMDEAAMAVFDFGCELLKTMPQDLLAPEEYVRACIQEAEGCADVMSGSGPLIGDAVITSFPDAKFRPYLERWWRAPHRRIHDNEHLNGIFISLLMQIIFKDFDGSVLWPETHQVIKGGGGAQPAAPSKACCPPLPKCPRTALASSNNSLAAPSPTNSTSSSSSLAGRSLPRYTDSINPAAHRQCLPSLPRFSVRSARLATTRHEQQPIQQRPLPQRHLQQWRQTSNAGSSSSNSHPTGSTSPQKDRCYHHSSHVVQRSSSAGYLQRHPSGALDSHHQQSKRQQPRRSSGVNMATTSSTSRVIPPSARQVLRSGRRAMASNRNHAVQMPPVAAENWVVKSVASASNCSAASLSPRSTLTVVEEDDTNFTTEGPWTFSSNTAQPCYESDAENLLDPGFEWTRSDLEADPEEGEEESPPPQLRPPPRDSFSWGSNITSGSSEHGAAQPPALAPSSSGTSAGVCSPMRQRSIPQRRSPPDDKWSISRRPFVGSRVRLLKTVPKAVDYVPQVYRRSSGRSSGGAAVFLFDAPDDLFVKSGPLPSPLRRSYQPAVRARHANKYYSSDEDNASSPAPPFQQQRLTNNNAAVQHRYMNCPPNHRLWRPFPRNSTSHRPVESYNSNPGGNQQAPGSARESQQSARHYSQQQTSRGSQCSKTYWGISAGSGRGPAGGEGKNTNCGATSATYYRKNGKDQTTAGLWEEICSSDDCCGGGTGGVGVGSQRWGGRRGVADEAYGSTNDEQDDRESSDDSHSELHDSEDYRPNPYDVGNRADDENDDDEGYSSVDERGPNPPPAGTGFYHKGAADSAHHTSQRKHKGFFDPMLYIDLQYQVTDWAIGTLLAVQISERVFSILFERWRAALFGEPLNGGPDQNLPRSCSEADSSVSRLVQELLKVGKRLSVVRRVSDAVNSAVSRLDEFCRMLRKVPTYVQTRGGTNGGSVYLELMEIVLTMALNLSWIFLTTASEPSLQAIYQLLRHRKCLFTEARVLGNKGERGTTGAGPLGASNGNGSGTSSNGSGGTTGVNASGSGNTINAAGVSNNHPGAHASGGGSTGGTGAATSGSTSTGGDADDGGPTTSTTQPQALPGLAYRYRSNITRPELLSLVFDIFTNMTNVSDTVEAVLSQTHLMQINFSPRGTYLVQQQPHRAPQYFATPQQFANKKSKAENLKTPYQPSNEKLSNRNGPSSGDGSGGGSAHGVEVNRSHQDFLPTSHTALRHVSPRWKLPKQRTVMHSCLDLPTGVARQATDVKAYHPLNPVVPRRRRGSLAVLPSQQTMNIGMTSPAKRDYSARTPAQCRSKATGPDLSLASLSPSRVRRPQQQESRTSRRHLNNRLSYRGYETYH